MDSSKISITGSGDELLLPTRSAQAYLGNSETGRPGARPEIRAARVADQIGGAGCRS